MKRTIFLIILDGWGIGEPNESNPIHVAHPPYIKWLEENFPVTSLLASGISVGLPWGEVGNSEVGHLTLGSGKVLYQSFPKITLAIQDESFFENPVLKDACSHVKANKSTLHLAGLLSSGTVHSSIDHLKALIKMATKEGVENVALHLFSDGEDSPPHSLLELIQRIPEEKIATLIGRYYAMDHNRNWSLTQSAYDCMIGSSGETVEQFEASIDATYKKNLSEGFLPALRRTPERSINNNDALLFFNFRADGVHQLASAFIDLSFDKFPVRHFENLFLATMIRYDESWGVPVAFPPDAVGRPLGQVISELGMAQLRIAESSRYPHVTSFFNGRHEEPFQNEYRILVPSLNVPHPEEHPEMMAPAITERLLETAQDQAFDLVVANYANPDTIAHTGNYEICVETVRIMDRELSRFIPVALEKNSIVLITSDHGNLEQVLSPSTGRRETRHDPSPVPFYLIAPEFRSQKFINWRDLAHETIGILSDVAPTILALMGIAKPEEMIGRSLLKDII